MSAVSRSKRIAELNDQLRARVALPRVDGRTRCGLYSTSDCSTCNRRGGEMSDPHGSEPVNKPEFESASQPEASPTSGIARANPEGPVSDPEAQRTSPKRSQSSDNGQKRVIPHDVRSALIASTIAALITIVLSPVSIWLGFSLNSILSRPNLSVEFVSYYEHHPVLLADLYQQQGVAFTPDPGAPSQPACIPYIRVSILNRGNTDGLILSQGFAELSSQTYSIERSPDPIAADESRLAVPTRVVNEGFAPSDSGLSVGKVPQNSMVEFWYEIKERPCNDSTPALLEVHLQDHLRNEIRHDTRD